MIQIKTPFLISVNVSEVDNIRNINYKSSDFTLHVFGHGDKPLM